MRNVASHVLTALVTLSLVALVFRLLDPPRPTARPRPAETYSPPAVAPAPLPVDLLKRVDADEQINILVYRNVNKSVVNITASSGRSGLPDEGGGGGSGSGFVLDKSGHILTNYHVVEGSDQLDVTLADGSTHAGEVIGRDPSSDVAVVKISAPAELLVPVALGDSTSLVVGQKVLALGNPFGLERTLTTGIVSSLDRSMKARNGRTIRGVVQTDAAINPGNSGGPLLDTRGRVVGITTAIVGPAGQSAGIGFAVPISMVARILKPLIEEGRVIRADLGIRRAYATAEGIYAVELVDGGPAETAGLLPLGTRVERVGPYYRRRLDPEAADRIIAVDGKAVKSVEDLLTEVEGHAPGESAELTVVRGGKKRAIRVELGRSQ